MGQLAKDQFNNQRKHTRFVRDDIKAYIIPVSFLSLQEPIACKLIDISSAGVQLFTKTKFETNIKLTLVLQFDNGHEFKLKAKIVRKKEINHYLSNHNFNIEKSRLKNKDNPLKSVHLIESGKKIEAKYRFLNMRCIRILTFSPLNPKKQYNLVFTLKDEKVIKIDSQFKHYQHHIYHDYGLKLEKTNDTLGEHLLDTQTDLIFK